MNVIGHDEVPLFAMNAGNGPLSYLQNSSYQGGALDSAKPIIEEEIETKLSMKNTLKKDLFIADFGCSTGHNSFPAMQFISDAINKKHESAQIHVIFNDVPSNDFNTLFTSLPPYRSYRAAAVPEDFHGRLLPESSLHFGYSSWSLHWMTGVPKEVADADSPAWNKGAILYARNRKGVYDCYLDQYRMGMGWFLESRAVEMVGGGMMALLIPGVPESWDPETEFTIPCDVNLLGSCLMDMAKEGRVSEDKIHSFNIPYYFTTPQQLKAILERNHSFSIERMETLDNNVGKCSWSSIKARAAFYRAVHERLLSDHFGAEIIDELFDLYSQKLAASPVFVDPKNDKSIVVLVVLKRKAE